MDDKIEKSAKDEVRMLTDIVEAAEDGNITVGEANEILQKALLVFSEVEEHISEDTCQQLVKDLAKATLRVRRMILEGLEQKVLEG